EAAGGAPRAPRHPADPPRAEPTRRRPGGADRPVPAARRAMRAVTGRSGGVLARPVLRAGPVEHRPAAAALARRRRGGGLAARPRRLAALAEVERRAVVGMLGTTDAEGRPATLVPGAADDLAEVVAALEREGADWPLGIERLVAHEDPSTLPGLWPRLVELL